MSGDQRGDKLFAAFDHDDESIAVILDVIDVFLAEITTVKDETNIFISVFLDLGHHVRELGNISYGSWIFLVKQRHTVGLVIGNGNVENRKSLIVLSFAILYDIDISGLAVFIGRVVRDVYPLFMITFTVPIILETKDLILGNGF